MVDNFVPGWPIFLEHGVEQIGRGVSAQLRLRDDGKWEVYAESDIEIPPGQTAESVVSRLPRGWSVGLVELEPNRPTNPVVTLAIDSMNFGDGDRAEAQLGLQLEPVPTYVTWYHQFAAVPDPAVVVDIVRHAALALPPEVWSELYGKLEEVVVRLIFHEPQRGTPIVFRMRSEGLAIELSVPPDAKPELIREVFRGARSVLRVRDTKAKRTRH